VTEQLNVGFSKLGDEVPLACKDNGLAYCLNRQAVIVALLHHLQEYGGMLMCVEFTNMSKLERISFCSYYATRIWIYLACGNEAEVNWSGHQSAEEFKRLLNSWTSADTHKLRLRQNISVSRHQVDPLLKKVSQPSYEFTTAHRDTSYTLEIFNEVANTSLRRIELTWPTLGFSLEKYINLIVHVPAANFRSCSAARFSGVVFLGKSDESLLDLEESLIHEWGHQVLYAALEINPMITNDSTEEFIMPWKRTKRDFYGYFHAYYIYSLLYVYMLKVSQSSSYYSNNEIYRAKRRANEIKKGLVEARQDFRKLAALHMTADGIRLIKELELFQGTISP
jgi:HEXXH motif-containing protein